MIVTCTPNPSVDRTVRIDRIQVGAVNRTSAATVEASGKGVNVTRVLVGYGHRSVAVLPAGGASGRELVDLLTADGVEARTVPAAQPVRVNLSVVTAGGQTTKFNEPGGRLSGDECRALVAAVAASCERERARWLALCGALPPDAPPELVADIVRAGHRAGSKVVVDTSGPALAAAVEAGADLIAPNLEELVQVLDAELAGVDAIARAANRFAPRSSALVSLGAEGAVLVRPDGRAWHAVAPTVTVVNTVGAGDSLLAGFLAADSDAYDSHSHARALAQAVAWGTSACTVAGTAEVSTNPVTAASIAVTELARHLSTEEPADAQRIAGVGGESHSKGAVT